MGPKINASQQRHVGALGNTLGETQVRGSPRLTSAHLYAHPPEQEGQHRSVVPQVLLPPRPGINFLAKSDSSGVYSLFGQTHASSHERTTITTPPCPSSFILDRTRVPWRNISETGDIS